MQPLLNQVSELYELNPLDYIEKVTKGYLSENHIISDKNKKYFLKKYRFNNEERIKQIHSVKQFFNEKGIPVIMPLSTSNGSTFFSYNKGFYTLFPFINKKQLTRGEPTKPAIISMAKTLAKMHLYGKDSVIKIDNTFNPWNKEESLHNISLVMGKIKSIKHKTNFDKLALKIILLKKKIIVENEIKYEQFNFSNDYLVHGDYVDQYIFLNDNDEIAYIFDFEKAQYSPRFPELFRSMMNSFLSGEINEENIKRAKLYLNTYCSIYPMPPKEIEINFKVYYLKTVHGLWVEVEHYLNNNNRADEFLKPNFEKILYFSKNLDKFAKILLE